MTISEQTLQELAKQFGLALDWSNNNVIPYLQDLAQRVITYEFRSSIFWIVIGAIFILIGIIDILIILFPSNKLFFIGSFQFEIIFLLTCLLFILNIKKIYYYNWNYIRFCINLCLVF